MGSQQNSLVRSAPIVSTRQGKITKTLFITKHTWKERCNGKITKSLILTKRTWKELCNSPGKSYKNIIYNETYVKRVMQLATEKLQNSLFITKRTWKELSNSPRKKYKIIIYNETYAKRVNNKLLHHTSKWKEKGWTHTHLCHPPRRQDQKSAWRLQ